MDGAVPGPSWWQASGGLRRSGPARPTPAGWAGSSRRREHISPLSLRVLGPLGRGAQTLHAGSRAPQSGTCVYGKSTVIHTAGLLVSHQHYQHTQCYISCTIGYIVLSV